MKINEIITLAKKELQIDHEILSLNDLTNNALGSVNFSFPDFKDCEEFITKICDYLREFNNPNIRFVLLLPISAHNIIVNKYINAESDEFIISSIIIPGLYNLQENNETQLVLLVICPIVHRSFSDLINEWNFRKILLYENTILRNKK